MWYTYLLSNKQNGYWYTGVTNDLRKRFKQHNDKLRKGWAAKRDPYTLMYYEACHDEDDARAREKYLKSGMGKKYIKNRLKRFLSLTG